MPLKWINICMEFEIVSGICYALYLSIRSCHFPKIWPWSQGCTHCFPRTWRKWKGSLLVKYSPFLSQFPKPCFDGNTLTFLERRKTRELHSICYGLWIWEMAAQERERNIFSSLTAQFTALACVMKDGLTGGKHINLFNTSFMWSKSPWKQNKEIGKPLHFKAKFHNEGDNHAEVLDKEVGPRDDTLEYLVRPRDNTLEDLARPDGSGFFFFFVPVSSQTDFLSSRYRIYEMRVMGTTSWSQRTLRVLLLREGQKDLLQLSLKRQDPCVGVMCPEPVSSLCCNPRRAGRLPFTLGSQRELKESLRTHL